MESECIQGTCQKSSTRHVRRRVTGSGLAGARRRAYCSPYCRGGAYHAKEDARERHVAACHEWLERELRQVKPDVIVALGATALAAILGRRLAIVEARGREPQLPSGTPVVATYHPSAVLRAPDEASRVKLRATLLADLKRAGRIAGQSEA